MAEPVSEPICGDASVELASNRTSMSFERTRMSADRTLMSALRTSLSLISFGFTIFQFFGKFANEANDGVVTDQSARNFGLSLVLLGVALLVACLYSHTRLVLGLDARRDRLHGEGLLKTAAHYRTTPTAMIAVLLLLIGLVAVLGMVLRAGPFR